MEKKYEYYLKKGLLNLAELVAEYLRDEIEKLKELKDGQESKS